MAAHLASRPSSTVGHPARQCPELMADAVIGEALAGAASSAQALERIRRGGQHPPSGAGCVCLARPARNDLPGAAAATRTNGGGLGM